MKKDYYGGLWKKLSALVARVNYAGNYVCYFSVIPVRAGDALLAELCKYAEEAEMEEAEVLPYVIRELRKEAQALEHQRAEVYEMNFKHRVEMRLHPERYDARGRRIRVRRAAR